MNTFQRALRSVTRKPIKSALLLLVIVTVSLLLLCGMACQNASIQTQDSTRQAVGAGLRLDANEANRSKRLDECVKQIGDSMEGSYGGVHMEILENGFGTQLLVYTDNSFESLDTADIEQLASVNGIADYNITTCITPVNPVNFLRIEDPDADQYSDMGGVVLIGNRNMYFDSNVLSGNVSLIDGRMPDQNDSNVCVISQELAEKNSLSVGACLKFNDYHDPENSTVYDAEVIGIYQVSQAMQPLMWGDTFRSENVIFTDLRFPEKAEGSEGEPCFEHAYFQVADTDNYDAVKKAVESVPIDWARYDLIDRNGNMQTMADNFHDLEQVSTLLIWIIFAAGFVILFLIFLFWTKTRNHEIGILLSLGCKKLQILGQLFTEAFLIAVLSFAIALPLAPAISSAAADYLVESQVEQAQLTQEREADYVSTGSDYQSKEPTVLYVDAQITPPMVLICETGVILLLGLAIGAAGITVLRKKPHEIFDELS